MVITFCARCTCGGLGHDWRSNDPACSRCGCPKFTTDTERQERLRPRREKLCKVLGHRPEYDDVNPYSCKWCHQPVECKSISCVVPMRYGNHPLGRGCGAWFPYEAGRREAWHAALLSVVRHVAAKHPELIT